MPFPTLIMGLIAKARLKLSSGLIVEHKDYPIGAYTVTHSTAHIRGSKTSVSQIPRDQVEEKGGDTEEEIERLTSAPETSAQPSSSTPAQGPNRLDHLLARVEQMYTMLDSHVQHTGTSLHTSRVRLPHYPHRLTTCQWHKDPIQSQINSSLFGHSSKKKGEQSLRGSLHS